MNSQSTTKAGMRTITPATISSATRSAFPSSRFGNRLARVRRRLPGAEEDTTDHGSERGEHGADEERELVAAVQRDDRGLARRAQAVGVRRGEAREHGQA